MNAANPESASSGDSGPSSGAGPARGVEIGDLETSGLTLRAMADGTIVATAQRVTVRRARTRTLSGAIDIATAVLTGVRARLSAGSSAQPPDLLEMSADKVRIEGMNAIINRMPPFRATHTPALHVDAMAELDGDIRAVITDALWIIDAEITASIVKGRIDFNRVIVEHIGPNSTMGIGPTGIHVTAPHRARVNLITFGAQPMPGVSLHAAGAPRSRVRDRGRLDLAPFIQAVFASAPGHPMARLADARLRGPLHRTRLSGELRMGNGRLGTATHSIVLTGREGGKNRIELSSLAIGKRLIVRAPQLAAASATLAVADKVLTTVAISAALDLHVIGMQEGANDTGSRAIAVAISEATLEHVRLAPGEST